MSTRPAQDQVALADFDPHFGGRGHVVHALRAGGDVGLIQRPRYTAQVLDGHIAVRMQSNHRPGLAWHHDTMARGDSTEVSLLEMEDGVATCFDERRRRGHLVVETSAVKTDHVHGCVGVMFCAPGQDLGEVRRVLVRQKDAPPCLRRPSDAVVVTKHRINLQSEPCGMLPPSVASEDRRRCIEEFRRNAARRQLACCEHQHVPCHGVGIGGFHKRIRAAFWCAVGNGF